MKISKIESLIVRIPYLSGGSLKAEMWGGQPWLTADSLLVNVRTDEGVSGWGEAFGYNVIPATKAAIDEMIAPICIGLNPLEPQTLMLELQQRLHIFGRGGPVIYALSGLDIALWDIVGKVARQPLYTMLGADRPGRLSAYASLVRYGDPAIVAANVARAKGLGYRHVKLHEITVPAVAAARSAAGPDLTLMLDVNCPWSVEEALDMAARLQPFDLSWLEEPVWPPEDYAGLSAVKASGGIPVAAGENAATLHQFMHMFEAGAVDIVQPSPAKIGGVTELRKVFALAKTHNVQVVPHTFYEGPAFLAGLHVNAALAEDPLVEWRFFDLEARLYGEHVVPRDGSVAVPQGPGLGIDPDPEVIRRYRAS